mmetsp:Transcript_7953/g.29758  ORF Transcript_7953/g.29758 Transcript_7953/m.29758 type:complete len:247 (+) Transcript_7953:1791-2531(+)
MRERSVELLAPQDHGPRRTQADVHDEGAPRNVQRLVGMLADEVLSTAIVLDQSMIKLRAQHFLELPLDSLHSGRPRHQRWLLIRGVTIQRFSAIHDRSLDGDPARHKAPAVLHLSPDALLQNVAKGMRGERLLQDIQHDHGVPRAEALDQRSVSVSYAFEEQERLVYHLAWVRHMNHRAICCDWCTTILLGAFLLLFSFHGRFARVARRFRAWHFLPAAPSDVPRHCHRHQRDPCDTPWTSCEAHA